MKLICLTKHRCDNRKVWINPEHITQMETVTENAHTYISFVDGRAADVIETAEEIMTLIERSENTDLLRDFN